MKLYISHLYELYRKIKPSKTSAIVPVLPNQVPTTSLVKKVVK